LVPQPSRKKEKEKEQEKEKEALDLLPYLHGSLTNCPALLAH